MNLIYGYAIITTMVAALLLIIGTNGFHLANASFCPTGQNIAICPGPYQLPIGKWNLYADGSYGSINVTSSTITGDINGTLQFDDIKSNTTAIGKLCTVSQPCNIKGIFDTYTGKLNFTSTPTVPTFIADIQNYTGFESSHVQGIDTKLYKLDGIGITVKPQPIKEFGWDAYKMCLVTGCIG